MFLHLDLLLASKLIVATTTLTRVSIKRTRTDTERSLHLLSQLLRLAPKLRILNLGGNSLVDLPASFIDAVLSHPSLEILDLNWNDWLAYPPHPSAPCAVTRFLTRLVATATSSSLTLRGLDVGCTELTASSCRPVLEQVLCLGSKGLESLRMHHNQWRAHDLEPLVQLVSEENRFIKDFKTDSLQADIEQDPENRLLFPVLKNTLDLALERNRRLQFDTHTAACELLEVARTILLACPPTALASSSPSFPSTHFRLLDLPSELLPIILSFLSPGALSDRQTGSVLKHAADRTTLNRPNAGQERPKRLAGWQKRLLLEAIGCYEYDFGR